MYVDLSSSLSYNRRNEPKLVFDDATKADTKIFLKYRKVPWLLFLKLRYKREDLNLSFSLIRQKNGT